MRRGRPSRRPRHASAGRGRRAGRRRGRPARGVCAPEPRWQPDSPNGAASPGDQGRRRWRRRRSWLPLPGAPCSDRRVGRGRCAGRPCGHPRPARSSPRRPRRPPAPRPRPPRPLRRAAPGTLRLPRRRRSLGSLPGGRVSPVRCARAGGQTPSSTISGDGTSVTPRQAALPPAAARRSIPPTGSAVADARPPCRTPACLPRRAP